MTRFPLRSWAILVAGQLAAGAVIGVVWLFISPRAQAYVLQGQNNAPVIIPAESESQVAADGRFFVLCVIAGLAAGIGAWYLIRQARGWQTLLVVAASGIASALLARWVGHTFASGTDSGPLQTVITPRLVLHGTAFLMTEAFTAVLAYTALAGFTSDPEFIAPAKPRRGEIDLAPEAADEMPDAANEAPVAADEAPVASEPPAAR